MLYPSLGSPVQERHVPLDRVHQRVVRKMKGLEYFYGERLREVGLSSLKEGQGILTNLKGGPV